MRSAKWMACMAMLAAMGLVSSARGADCQKALAEFFDLAKSGKGGTVVQATLMIHYPGPLQPSNGPAHLATGPLSFSAGKGTDKGNENGKEYLAGKLTSYTLDKSGAVTVFTFAVNVRRDGEMTIGQLVADKNFLGRPPVTFQPKCTAGGLFYAIVDKNTAGNKLFTRDTMITLTLEKGTMANVSLKVTLRPQLTNMWCWAASGQMVMEFLGKNIPQCDQANKRFGRKDCCTSPTPQKCVKGGFPEFNKFGFSFNQTSDQQALTWDQLTNQLGAKKKPVAFAWHWEGGGGHMMVVIGFQRTAGYNFVEINDPWPPNQGDHRVITYDAFVNGQGYYHWWDYYDVVKKP